jgi:Tfp pilus assembly protein PilN
VRVNLLPPEVRRARRDAGILRRIRFAGFALLLLLGGVYAIRTAEVFFLRGDLDDLRVQQAAVQAERQQLAEVAAARDAAVSARALGAQLLRGDISWSEQLLQLSQAIPTGFTLTSMSGSTSPGDVPGLVGTVTFSASSRDVVPTQTWLIRIAAQEGWANGWVSSISAEEGSYAVSGSFDLTPAALSARGGASA